MFKKIQIIIIILQMAFGFSFDAAYAQEVKEGPISLEEQNISSSKKEEKSEPVVESKDLKQPDSTQDYQTIKDKEQLQKEDLLAGTQSPKQPELQENKEENISLPTQIKQDEIAPEEKLPEEVKPEAFLTKDNSIEQSEVSLENQAKKEPIMLTADKLEYSMDKTEVTATGDVRIDYKGSILTCQKMVLNTVTKEGLAEGSARLDDKQGVIEGNKISYNFETKKGIVINPNFRANPYFGKANKLDRVSENEFISYNGYFTTCNLDNPHWRILSKKVNMFPGDKVQTQGNKFYLGKMPVLYLPKYNHSFKDPMMHVRIMPGQKKDWGPYVLSAWKYNITKYINGRMYFDVRKKMGTAEGVGANYDFPNTGKGNFYYYFMREIPERVPGVDTMPTGTPTRYTRSLLRLRHQWDIDKRTDLIAEFYKIVDQKRKKLNSNTSFLKDYFFREYEKDTTPLTYAILRHNFSYSTLSLLMQARTNHWFAQTNKLPELSYSLPSISMFGSPFYYENSSIFGNYNQMATTLEPTSNEESVTSLDMTNKFSLPSKVSIFRFTPYVSSRQTFYDKGYDDLKFPIRTIFYSGADISTKFYRILNVNNNFLGLDIHGLRHIITPSVGYAYNHDPTIPSSKLKVLGAGNITASQVATLNLSNKLQTKRDGKSVDLVDFLITSSYTIKPKDATSDRKGSHLTDFVYTLKFLPYSWLSLNADATYKHSGPRSDTNYKKFSNVNADLDFNFGPERSFGLGKRYQRKGSNETTYSFKWRINPKWSFSIYQRRERGHDVVLGRGLKEQEYTVTRDLHCWAVDMSYNGTRGKGSTIWFVFRLKAFPETEFNFNQSYHQPKPGAEQKK